MSLAEWCIKNNRSALAIFLLIFSAGLFTYFNISKLEEPEFVVKTAVITTDFPGASPEKVEELVTDKVEEKIREISEVDYIDSQSLRGLSIVYLTLQSKFKDLKPIWDKLRDKMQDLETELPEGVGTPNVNDEFGDVYGILVAVTGDGYSYNEIENIVDETKKELFQVENVGKIQVYGIQDERVFIEFSNARLAEYGFSPFQLAESLSKQNSIQDSGDSLLNSERVVIQSSGQFNTIEELKYSTFRRPNSTDNVYLRDLAEVKRGYIDPSETMFFYNGKPSILLAVNMAKGGNIIAVSKAIKEKLKEIEARTAVGIEFNLFVDQAKYVSRNIKDLSINLLEAFILVCIVVLTFCGVRMGLIIGSLVPMAIMMCIMLLPIFDIALQRVSIAALIIALGMLVDNGVVVSENILVKLTNGIDRLTAVRESVKELATPLLAASLTTIFAFLPIAIAKSEVGEYCFSLFLVITLTLLCSWILSISFIPMLSFYFLKPYDMETDDERKFYEKYKIFLVRSLKKPYEFLVGIFILMALGLAIFSFVPKIFFPPNEREMMIIDFVQPYGTDIMTTRSRVAELEEFLLADKTVEEVGSFIGTGGPRWNLASDPDDDRASYSLLLINTKKTKDVDALMLNTRKFIEDKFPNTRATVKKLESGTPVGEPIQIRVSGNDISKLYDVREKIVDIIKESEGTYGIHDDWGEWQKTIVINVNQDKAKRAGLSTRDIALSLQSQFSGLFSSEFREQNEAIPIIIRSNQIYRNNLSNIEGMNVYSYEQNLSVPLLQVAKPDFKWETSNIRRRDQIKTMTIKSNVTGRVASEVLAEIVPKLEKLKASKDWPLGFNYAFGGEEEEIAKAEKSIFDGMPIAFGLLLLVLIYQFNSFRRAFIILFTIPPMLIGVSVGLLVTGSSFGFMALLGLISLMGIIVNNAIMLIDRIEMEKEAGKSQEEAIIASSLSRFRPIVMTTVTTIVGLIPLSIQGGEFWSPMANVIIFGLAAATVLTLVLCPVLYSIFFKANFEKIKVESLS